MREIPSSRAVVSLTLSSDEALVLFEFVQRFTDTDRLSVADPAEEQVLWNLGSMLERLLAEPFDPAYPDLLRAARDRLRGDTQS